MPEFTIVGAGLAGTTLAWALVRSGRTVRLIDREPPTTTSRVAAGLLTPITGKKPAVSWRWHELRPAAERFYREVEGTSGRSFFHSRPIVRVMSSEKEREAFTRSEFTGLVAEVDPPLSGENVPQPFGAVLMPSAAQLDTVDYLNASREQFKKLGMYERGEWNERTEADGVTVLCQGYVSGGVFPLPFRPAKGEILTVRIPGFDERRALNRGGWWLAPVVSHPSSLGRGRIESAANDPGVGSDEGANPTPAGSTPFTAATPPQRGGVDEYGQATNRDTLAEVYRFGATYSWDRLDDEPTVTGRDELASKLGELVRLPFEVRDHMAGVRPIVAGQKPVLGRHPTIPRLTVFNGLSSKGALSAPFFAEMLADHLCDGTPIDPEVDVRLRVNWEEP